MQPCLPSVLLQQRSRCTVVTPAQRDALAVTTVYYTIKRAVPLLRDEVFDQFCYILVGFLLI